MPTLELTRAHRADLEQLTGLASNDLSQIWVQLDAASSSDGLMDVLPQLVAVYGSAAATLGADWYDELRVAEEVAGSFTAVTAELPDTGRTYALAGWGAAEAAKDAATALTLVTGGLQRIIANADRQSVAISSVADPRAEGWKRVGRGGGGGCDWCQMLIGRGFVYREATAKFESHDHCFCTAVPEFG